MREVHLRITATLLLMCCATVVTAQQPTAATAVPKLVQFSGSFRPANGQPVQSVESVTLAVYRDQAGGAPLWQEIQNVAVDIEGHYSVLLGATKNDGMPLDLFTSGEPRWLSAQFNRSGETEQARVLLVSVPYALKAADAETLGGKPASAYLLAPSAANTVGDGSVNPITSPNTAGTTSPSVKSAVKPRTVSGQINRVAKFVDATNDVGNSSIVDANGFVGISTVAPLISLDVRTGSLPQMGIAGNTDYLTFFASDVFGPAIYWDPAKDMRFGKGGAGLYNPFGFVEQMRIQSSTGNVGVGTPTPASKLDVAGDINFSGSVRFQGSPALRVSTGVGGPFGNNTAFGIGALQSNTGPYNTAIGNAALQNSTTGTSNTAIGEGALFANTSGGQNTATGAGALQNNTTGGNNTANGIGALGSNTTGESNIAIGPDTLFENTTGSSNTAVGSEAMSVNTTGGDNSAVGEGALGLNKDGMSNTAMGGIALLHNTSGNFNTALGNSALAGNTTGSNNIGIGFRAGTNGLGGPANPGTGTNNIAIGSLAANEVDGGNSNNIHIASVGFTNDNGTIRIGDSSTQTSFFAAGIRGVTTGANDAIPVVIDSNGQLGTVSSSRRFKDDIEDMGEASRNLMRLRPVTYRYKKPFVDGSRPIQYGLIAEEVSEVYPDLVAHSADGQIETVKYQVLDSMLLNEVQRQQAEIRGLEEQNRILKQRMDKLEKILTAISPSPTLRQSGTPKPR